MTDFLIFVPVGYLLGAIPVGLAVAWTLKRVDVREVGSGKTGMTNVLRSVGVPAAILVLLLDMGKAILAVFLARIFSGSEAVEAAAALAALFGHNWSVFIGFKGGRGTAPGWGGLFILSPLAGIVATAVGPPIVAITRYMSLASILGAAAGSATLVTLSATDRAPEAYLWYGAIGGPLVVLRHADNIRRLLKGQERKIGKAAQDVQHPPKAGRRKGWRWPTSA